MPLNTDEVLSVLSQLAETEQLRVSVYESAKGALIAGALAFAGGLVAGPPGLAVGGIAGSLAAYFKTKDRFRRVADVIMYDMTAAQRCRLAESASRILQDLSVEDLRLLLPLVLNNASVKERLLLETLNFLRGEMHLSVTGSPPL